MLYYTILYRPHLPLPLLSLLLRRGGLHLPELGHDPDLRLLLALEHGLQSYVIKGI